MDDGAVPKVGEPTGVVVVRDDPLPWREVAASTDVDRAARVVAKAANRLRRLESEAELAFREWVAAQAQAKEAGLPVEVELGPGLQAALSEHRQRLARIEAQAIAREEMGTRRGAP